MQVGYFGEALKPFVDGLQEAAEYTSFVYHEIMIRFPDIYDREPPHRICGSTRQPCSPACRMFDPQKACWHGQVSQNYRSLTEGLWEYRVRSLSHTEDWKLFYDCFWPPKKKKKEGLFTAEFPNDVPVIPDALVRSNAHATKGMKDDDPGKWTEQRVHAAIHGKELQRRMATTDWDWQWYNKAIADGHQVSMTVAKNKVRLDRIMFKKFGDSYETGGTYKVEKVHPDFLKVQLLYNQLKHMMDIRLEFE